jgi:hypothetical protein
MQGSAADRHRGLVSVGRSLVSRNILMGPSESLDNYFMRLATAEVSCCLREFYEWTVDTNR